MQTEWSVADSVEVNDGMPAVGEDAAHHAVLTYVRPGD